MHNVQRFTSAVGSIKGMKHGIHASLVFNTPTDQELLAKSLNVMAEQNDEMCYRMERAPANLVNMHVLL